MTREERKLRRNMMILRVAVIAWVVLVISVLMMPVAS